MIGAGCEIQDGAVLGQVAEARALVDGVRPRALAPLSIGDRAVVCCGAIVFAGARLGEGVIVGDQAYVRERAEIGAGSGDRARQHASTTTSRIGARAKVQTDVYVTAYSVVEDDVFVGPGVCTTNDSTMSRHDTSYALRGAGAAAGVPGRRRRRARRRASRSARRRSSPPARSSRATCRRARS